MAIVFTLISMVMTFFILFAVQETSSRLAWAFARDKGLIYSNLFEKIHPRLEVPVYSLVLTWALLAISGCVFMASTTGKLKAPHTVDDAKRAAWSASLEPSLTKV